MLEIVVAIVILSLVLVSLLNVFLVGKRYTMHSRSVMVAAELGKYFLDPLQYLDVRDDTWNAASNNLSVNAAGRTGSSIILQNINFTPTYYVYDVGVANSSTPIRKVRLELHWNETSP